MGKVTAIKQQQKRDERVSVYVDKVYRFSLTKDQAANLGIHIGQQLTDEEISRLQTHSEFGKLRDSTFRWLSLRPRSRYEIDQYLQRKTDDESLRGRLMGLLQELGYVDDERFAKSWIQHRTLVKPMSMYRLKQELLQKGVPKEIIDKTLETSDVDELAALKDLIRKRKQRYQSREKLMAYLARQGFSYDLVKQALEQERDD